MATRLERLIAIEREIGFGSFPNVPYLCRMFDVKPRTIYEDIRILREGLGLDIRFDRARNGYFNARPDERLPPFEFTRQDVLLLAYALSLLLNTVGQDWKQQVVELQRKICDRLPASLGHAFQSAMHGDTFEDHQDLASWLTRQPGQ